MVKTSKEKIKSIITKQFTKKDKIQFYFVKGIKKYSNAIITKNKSELDPEKIKKLEVLLRNELKNPLIELLNWVDTIGGLIPRKNIYKVPFFDTKEVKEFNPWRVCPVGEYWVSRHDREKKHLEDVDGHCRKNHKGRDLIKGNEIGEIAQSEKFKKIKIKTTKGIINKLEDSDTYNDLITGWTAYWNDQFKLDPPLNPNFVKVLIATESGFNPKAKKPNNPSKIGAARGLMQITVDTQNRLGGKNKELKDHFVVLTNEDIYDPNKNICAGVRWLFRKRETARARLKHEPTWEDVLMEFKGRLKSKTQKTQEIREQIKDYLRVLNEK